MKKLESQMDIFLKIYNMKLKVIVIILIISFFYGKAFAQLKNYSFSTGSYSSKALAPKLKYLFNEKDLFYAKYIKNNYLLFAEKPIHSKYKNLNYCIGVGYNSEKYIFFEGDNLNLKNFIITVAIEKIVAYQKKASSKINCFGIGGIGISSAFNNSSYASYYNYKIRQLNIALQFSPLNIQFKIYKNLLLKCGFGYGYKGVFNMGIAFNE